jgi:hypothetical protein
MHLPKSALGRRSFSGFRCAPGLDGLRIEREMPERDPQVIPEVIHNGFQQKVRLAACRGVVIPVLHDGHGRRVCA